MNFSLTSPSSKTDRGLPEEEGEEEEEEEEEGDEEEEEEEDEEEEAASFLTFFGFDLDRVPSHRSEEERNVKQRRTIDLFDIEPMTKFDLFDIKPMTKFSSTPTKTLRLKRKKRTINTQ